MLKNQTYYLLLLATEAAALVRVWTIAAWGLGLDGSRNRDRAGLGAEAAGPAASLDVIVDAAAALGVGLDGSRGEANDGESHKGGSDLHGNV